MKNVLFKDLEWENIEYIGFDMDGTLYDEYDFIVQPYEEISKLFKNDLEVFNYMTSRWILKGSSYNRIFDETFELYATNFISGLNKNEFINKSLDIFRNYNPSLSLSQRVKFLLEFYRKDYKLFLVTDGNINLQKKKFEALSLGNYFDNSNVVFTGIDTEKYEKPASKSLELLNIKPQNSIFFGDRIKDKQYAKNLNMQFKMVYNMIEVNS